MNLKKEKGLSIPEMRKALRSNGAGYARGLGWAYPDANTGTIWGDDSSYNETVFLGSNARDAFYQMVEMICDHNERGRA